jgi:3-oxoacid CoA-transferase subunit A
MADVSPLFATLTKKHPGVGVPSFRLQPAHILAFPCGTLRFVQGADLDKRIASADAAIAKLSDGATILMGGFGLCGIPENLIAAVRRRGTKDLTIVSNNAGVDDFGIGLLLQNRQVKKMISTYVGENKLFERLVLSGEMQVELNPQGTLAERLRAGGAGIPAFYTPTGFGTMVAEGKETREFDGRPCVLERALRGNFAFIKAWKGDHWGNLIYRKTARNFNPMMATAADYVIAEVEHLVEPGQLDPDQVHTPGIFINAIFQGPSYTKRIEKRTIRNPEIKLDRGI